MTAIPRAGLLISLRIVNDASFGRGRAQVRFHFERRAQIPVTIEVIDGATSLFIRHPMSSRALGIVEVDHAAFISTNAFWQCIAHEDAPEILQTACGSTNVVLVQRPPREVF